MTRQSRLQTDLPWLCFVDGQRLTRTFRTKDAAINWLRRTYRDGRRMVLNRKTGERWTFNGRAWERAIVAGQGPRRHGKTAAAAGLPGRKGSGGDSDG